MFEVATVNPIGILVMLVLWGVSIWAITFVWMSEKIRQKDEIIKFLDIYIEDVERDYGHVMDDYFDMYYSDGEWVKP